MPAAHTISTSWRGKIEKVVIVERKQEMTTSDEIPRIVGSVQNLG
uniref:Uncharacterized protein n=1 Tax=Candidatus Kentrum sp. TUN TaxID=2126343 RepID=A0A451AE30_9GAMM|nr:MAG: hypothetical protein BECKTUN1418F_GA0071002_10315 [Candidatus Kentron sp. TUN]VFK55705.1 MAG: hypothetical protein BECKTUN1418E_GA0071001_10325 [Candidatus Kentron sp. TUN]VFK64299.1 MAG: hypothetical protein BECKTUN1418D_GA0071000_12554 [Candidatus Kentron sp. TUN]